MKGIRKLFFGLILMTLIGVGFKVNANAATGIYFQVEDKDGNKKADDINVSKWTKEDDMICCYFYMPSGSGAEDTYELEVKLDNDLGVDSSIPSTIIVPSSGMAAPELLDSMERSDARKLFTDNSTGGYFAWEVTGTKNGTPIATKNSAKIYGWKINPMITTDIYDEGPTDATITPTKDTPVYMLENDTLVCSINTKPTSSAYTFNGWLLGDSNTKLSGESPYTLLTSKLNKSYSEYDLRADYNKKSGSLTFTKSDLDGAVLSPGKQSAVRDFTLTGYTVADIKKDAKIYINDEDIPFTVSGTSTEKTGTLKLHIPAGATEHDITDPGALKIVMYEGTTEEDTVYEADVYVIAPANVELTIEPNSPQTIEVDEKLSITSEFNVPVKTTTLGLNIDGKNKYLTNTSSDTNLSVTGKATTTTSQEVYAVATGLKFDWGTYSKTINSKTFNSVADVTVVAPTLKLKDPVEANVGLKVPLSYYTGSGGININGIASSYITASGTKGLAKTITLEGKSATTLKDGAITVTDSDGNSVTSDVIVYPKPTISADRSGTGSNTKYTFKISAPTAVYDGKSAYTDVDSAVLQFKGSKDTYEYSESISLKPDGTSTIKQVNSDTISIDIKKLREIFDKICEDDKEEVKVTVAPKENTSYKSDAYTLKVYKIKLDGSAGADYKVMGESVSDSFYAIDGVSYEIAASPKSGYSGTPTKWDGTSFGTSASGSTSFSESKTVKAYYNGGTSSLPNSSTPGRNSGAAGEGMDDYDDVPKTGESKTDIWILWSVLFVSILGAGFMIWKRFGLVRAIAEADEEVAVAEHKEEVKAQKKEKEDKLKMLKDLRNL